MPIKNQTKSYRIKKGKKFIAWADRSLTEGKKELKKLRNEGKEAFGKWNKEGYYRVFIREDQK